jgi:sulfoxide reductase heme-binding subunit YedZ
MRAAKNNFGEWSIYALVLGVLLGWRVWKWQRTRRAAPASVALRTR